MNQTLLQIAQRNIRQYVAKASFSSQVDRIAANNCLDVMDEALTALGELDRAEAEPVATVLGIVVEWTGEQPPEAGTKLYAAPPAKPAPDIYDAYKSWPEDIRKKLSLHDLRRMSGWRMQAEFNPLNHEQSR